MHSSPENEMWEELVRDLQLRLRTHLRTYRTMVDLLQTHADSLEDCVTLAETFVSHSGTPDWESSPSATTETSSPTNGHPDTTATLAKRLTSGLRADETLQALRHASTSTAKTRKPAKPVRTGEKLTHRLASVAAQQKQIRNLKTELKHLKKS